MDPQYHLSAKRLYALMGDRLQDFPPHVIDHVERRLEAFETARNNRNRVSHLRLVPDRVGMGIGYAHRQRMAEAAVPIRTLQRLSSVFEILYSLHTARMIGQPDTGFDDFLIEELLRSGRDLLCSSLDDPWGRA